MEETLEVMTTPGDLRNLVCKGDGVCTLQKFVQIPMQDRGLRQHAYDPLQQMCLLLLLVAYCRACTPSPLSLSQRWSSRCGRIACQRSRASLAQVGTAGTAQQQHSTAHH